MDGLFLEYQTWPKVKKYLEKSNMILIPMGSIENEGKNLPLGLDTHVSQYLCESVSKKTGCMVGPCLPLGYSKWFMNFPGTISLEHSTITILIREYCECLYKHGFRKFIFINSHVGNGNAIADVGRDIRKKDGLVVMVDIWRNLEKIAKGIKLTEKSVLSHGGEIGTSIALAIYSQYVATQHTKGTELSSPLSENIRHINTLGLSKFKDIDIWAYLETEEITKTGSIGDTSTASKQKGEILLDKMIISLEDLIEELRHLNFQRSTSNV